MNSYIDLSKFTTEELEDMYKKCIAKISNMTADLENAILCAAIEKELQKRK